MKNGRTGDQELLVARNNQGGEEICGRVRCLPTKQESHRATSQQINAKLNTREALDAYIGRLYYEVALSSGIRLNLSSSRQTDENGTFHTYYRENVGRRTGQVIQG